MEKVVETIYFVRYNIFCFFVWNGRSNFFLFWRGESKQERADKVDCIRGDIGRVLVVLLLLLSEERKKWKKRPIPADKRNGLITQRLKDDDGGVASVRFRFVGRAEAGGGMGGGAAIYL